MSYWLQGTPPQSIGYISVNSYYPERLAFNEIDGIWPYLLFVCLPHIDLLREVTNDMMYTFYKAMTQHEK